MSNWKRRQTVTVDIGGVKVGSEHPVVVQSMTNTDTADVEKSVTQVEALAAAGSEIVRVTVNNHEAARAVPEIVARLRNRGVTTPIVGDFHYNGHLLLRDHPECARTLGKYRINPGNVGTKRRDENFQQIVAIAVENDKPVRIGVNWGSLDQDLLTDMMDRNAAQPKPLDAPAVLRAAIIESAVRSAELAERTGLRPDQILLSAKVSEVSELVAVYQQLAARLDASGLLYPLHLGLTEAGMGAKGIVASSVALAPLLIAGIGDTIRISLTPEPGGDRTLEVQVGQQILQSLGIRSFEPQVTSCPGCGRTTSTFFQEMAQDIQAYLRQQLPVWRERYPGVEDLSVAVMGCVVNGPGESRHSDIGISLPGTFEEPKAPVYVDGEHYTTLKGEGLVEEFKGILEAYVERRYGVGGAGRAEASTGVPLGAGEPAVTVPGGGG